MEAEYVSNPKFTFRDIAERYGLHTLAVQHRAARDGWDDKRSKLYEQKLMNVASYCAQKRAEELDKLNEADLSVSRALRAQIGKIIQQAQASGRPLLPKDIRALATAHESIQKTARLALGASTEHIEQHTRDQPAKIDPTKLSSAALEEVMTALDVTGQPIQ